VLLEGESGTGKELFARAIHFNSPRAKAPFIAFSCAALAESLLTSELFGHEKGAFTGAQARHIGRFERADGGTLFLDEIGEAPPATQVALLRVLETREFERVGGMTALKADVRLIAATNSKLEEKVRAGEFREDLFYRLQVVRLPLPPLRERASDIPLLVEHFLNEFAQEHHKPVPRVSREAMARLISEPWPGNVRELRNVIENTVIFLDGETIEENLLPPKASGHSVPNGAPQLPLGVKMADVEREHIRRSLLMHDGNVTRTAEALGLGRRTLQRKLKEMQLNKKEKVS
jgi:two-component system response regulator HydG